MASQNDKKKEKMSLPEVERDVDKFLELLKEFDPDLQVREELLSAAALNPFIRNNSSPRGLMFSSHAAQCLVLNEPKKPIITTGLEVELGKGAIVKKIENDSEVISVIKRYDERHISKKPTEYVIIYRDLTTGEIDVLRIPYFSRLHPYFGFKFNRDEEYLENLFTGDIIPAGKILAWSNGYDPNTGEYTFTTTLNVMLASDNDVGEDGMVISESAAKKLGFKMFENRKAQAGESSFFLNLYGTEDEFKPIPELWEEINETSAVTAIRKTDDTSSPILYSRKAMRQFNPIFDIVNYVKRPGGKVVDLKVYYSPLGKKNLPKGTDTVLKKYSDALRYFYNDILNVYKSLEEEYNKIQQQPPISKKFYGLVLEAINIVESSKPGSKIKKLHRQDPMDIYRVDIDIEFDVTPTKGYKITDLHGSKGVIVQVRPDDEMPVDEDGNRADVIADPAATVSRLNIGRLYERFMGAACRRVKKLITDKINEAGGFNNLTDKVVKEIFNDIVLEFVKLLGNKQYDVYKQANVEEMREVIKEAYEDEFRIFIPADNPKEPWEIARDILNSRFRPPLGPVTFMRRDKDGTVRYHKTKDPVAIRPMRIMLLNKIADGILTCSSAKLNHFGVPIGVSKHDKYRMPIKKSPVRALGETETRAYVAYVGREFVAELKDRGTSVETHGLVYENILKADKPTNINEVVDRNAQPFGGDRALMNFETLLNTVGLEIKFSTDKRRFIDPLEEDYEDLYELVDLDKVEGYEEEDDTSED